MADPKLAPKPLPTPRRLGQIGTTLLGSPVFAVQRTDGLVVSVVVPGRMEEK
jgi:hypothetical protein